MFQTKQVPMEYALRTVLRSTRGITASTSSMSSVTTSKDSEISGLNRDCFLTRLRLLERF
ncbi:hypothetical protein QTP88_024444 [Uroleucon formosanum]